MALTPAQALERVPLLADLGKGDLERLAERFEEHVFPPGSTIIAEGTTGPRVLAFFVIVEGRATVSAGGKDTAALHPGDYFGEIALIHDIPRTATVQADTNLRCLAMSAWDFRPFVEEHPNVAWTLLENLAQRLEQAPQR